MIFTNESKHIYHHHEIKLQRETFALFFFITYPVAKAAGDPRGGSTTLATETVTSLLVDGR